jgi:hypothetical protein
LRAHLGAAFPANIFLNQRLCHHSLT